MAKRNAHHPSRKRKASSQDVLGSSTQHQPIPRKWEKHYRRLIELRDHFVQRQSMLAQDAIEEQPTFSTHMADAGTDTYDRDFALSMLSSEQGAVYEIDQALDRVRHGSYGRCELTDKPIEPERLEAIPWTRFSAKAEKELERQGTVRRAGLGPRDTVVKEVASRGEEEAA